MEQLQAQHNGAICCTLVYGSCLRSGDIYDGLLDLYLICDSYRSAYRRRILAAANWLLPPNVFYAEQQAADNSVEGKTLYSKVTVISLHDFLKGCSRAWFQSYIWGRFAQPTRIIYYRDEQLRARVEAALSGAARTLLQNALPALPAEGPLTSLWQQSLSLSYGTELRSERSGRPLDLARSFPDFYAALTRHHTPNLGFPFELFEKDGEWHYRSHIGFFKRRFTTIAWALRRIQGKLLSIVRLVKALFTFERGLDYLAWKLERHTGEQILIPDKVRRMPFIYLWGFCWSLYRRGFFK